MFQVFWQGQKHFFLMGGGGASPFGLQPGLYPEVDQMSTRNFLEHVKHKLPLCSGFVALSQLNPIYKKEPQGFYEFVVGLTVPPNPQLH